MGGFQEGNDSDEDFEMKYEDVKWIGVGVCEKGRLFYSSVTLDGSLELHQGDTVFVKQTNPQAKLKVATIRKLYKSPLGASAHLQYFCYATDTLVGDMAEIQELYFTDECGNVALTQIWMKCSVERRLDSSPPLHKTLKPEEFWASHWYVGGNRIETIPAPIKILQDQDVFLSFCEACARKNAIVEEKKPKIKRNNEGKITGVRWKGKILRPGDGVMVPSNSVELPGKKAFGMAYKLWEEEEHTVDNSIYTEAYRKKNTGERGQTKAQCKPLQICQIVEIKEKKTKIISLRIRLFYRPGNFSCCV